MIGQPFYVTLINHELSITDKWFDYMVNYMFLSKK